MASAKISSNSTRGEREQIVERQARFSVDPTEHRQGRNGP